LYVSFVIAINMTLSGNVVWMRLVKIKELSAQKYISKKLLFLSFFLEFIMKPGFGSPSWTRKTMTGKSNFSNT